MLASFFFLVLSSLIALPYFINPNDFKPEIVEAVKERTGRELELSGDLSVSFFPWLGISTGKVILHNTQGFQGQPFATIERSEIKVKLIPLLSKKIEVSRIILKGVSLNLVKNKFGIGNWDYSRTQTKDQKQKTTEINNKQTVPEVSGGISIAALAVNGIAIEQAHINWDNQETGKHLEVKDVNLNSGKFTFDQPVDLGVSFVVVDTEGKLTDSVNLTSKVKVTNGFNNYQLTDFDLKFLREGDIVPGHSLAATLAATDIAFDNARQSLKITGVRVNSGEIAMMADISGENIIDKPSIRGKVTIAEFNPAKAMKKQNIAIPAMQDANALSTLAINFDLLATAESMDIQNLVCRLDNSLIKGTTSIKNFTSPEINFNLTVDAVDVDRYLSPKAKTAKSIASPAVALAAGLSKLPVESLRKLNLSGALRLNKLKINGLMMSDIQLKLDGKKGIVTSRQSINQLYQGSYVGDLSMDLRSDQTVLSVTEKIDRVQIESLLKDFNGKARMSGVLNASAQLQGRGRSSKALKSSLNGKFNIFLKNGAIKGFNLQKIIDSGKSLVKGGTPDFSDKSDQTVFSEIKGSANLRNGVVQNNDLVAKSAKFWVDGKGRANLNTERLDYKLVTRLIKEQATPTETEQFHSTPLVITVGGSFDKPTYTLDVAALLTDKNKAKIDKLIDKINKKIGPGASELLKSFF